VRVVWPFNCNLTAVVTWVFIGLTSVFAVGGFQKFLDFF
jgi:hypothetical protein